MNRLMAALVFCAWTVGLAAVGPGDFKYRKVLTAADRLPSDVGVFTLDDDLYRETADDLADLRLIGPDGHEVPYVARLATRTDTVTLRYPIELKTVDFKEQPDNSITFIVRREMTDSIPDELEIMTSAVNFEKSVSVYGSEDRLAWRTIADHHPIFDYSRYLDVRNSTVPLKSAACTYYKVVIGNALEVKRSPFTQIVNETGIKRGVRYESFVQNAEPFRIEQAVFRAVKSQVRAANPLQVACALPVTGTSSDTTEKATLMYCRSERQPINEIRLVTTSRIFRRQVEVAGTDDTTRTPTWTPLATGIVYRLKIGAWQQEDLRISLGGSHRYLRYRLRIANEDNPPIEVTGVSAMGEIHRVYFFRDQAETLMVYYGGEQVKQPRYDVAALLAGIPQVESSSWRLGAQLPVGEKGPVRRWHRLSPKSILIVSLVLMVGVLAGVLFVTVKNVEKRTER